MSFITIHFIISQKESKKCDSLTKYQHAYGHIRLFQETVEGLVELLERFFIIVTHGIHDAMLKMILQDDAADPLDGAVNSRKLDEHVTAVPAIRNHLLDGFEMANEPCHTIEDSLGLRMAVLMTVHAMRMRHDGAVSQHMGMFLQKYPFFPA